MSPRCYCALSSTMALLLRFIIINKICLLVLKIRLVYWLRSLTLEEKFRISARKYFLCILECKLTIFICYHYNWWTVRAFQYRYSPDLNTIVGKDFESSYIGCKSFQGGSDRTAASATWCACRVRLVNTGFIWGYGKILCIVKKRIFLPVKYSVLADNSVPIPR